METLYSILDKPEVTLGVIRMKSRESSMEVLIESAYSRQAVQLLQENFHPKEVIAKLNESGLESEKALELVNMLIQAPAIYSRMRGKQKIWLGSVVILITMLFSIIVASIFSVPFYIAVYSAVLVWGPGVVVFIWGLLQYTNKNPRISEKQEREFNNLLYAVDEIEKTWICPNCDYKNSNFTYKCEKCGNNLLK